MRAFVLTGPRAWEVTEVQEPVAGPGEAVVEVTRAGVCGTDVECFTGEMAYLRDGHAHYPMRLGHEWTGTVSAVGEGVEETWLQRRVMGDTMLGDGTCRRCRRGHQHVCEHREEVGIRGDRPGALAQRLVVPARSLHPLPDTVDEALGALVEPGANALRAVRAAGCGPGDRLLVLGPGTIGLLCAMFARADGAEVVLMGVTDRSLAFARGLGFPSCVREAELDRTLPYDAVIDCSDAARLPGLALELVEPAGRVVYIGLSAQRSEIDTRALVLADVTATGILSGSPALAETIALYGSGAVDPRPLVAATVDLEAVGPVLDGWRPPQAGEGPKIHVDPQLIA